MNQASREKEIPTETNAELNLRLIPAGKSRVVVGVGEASCSSDPNDIIVTHALGSCLGVCLFPSFLAPHFAPHFL